MGLSSLATLSHDPLPSMSALLVWLDNMEETMEEIHC